jgi:TolA-binding protein
MNSKIQAAFHSSVLFGVSLLAACASTTPKAEYSQDLRTQYRIDADDRPQVNVNASAGVEITDLEKQRIAQLIGSDLEVQRLRNAANNDPKDCVVEVTITRYQKGNAFARAMLAGLGQIHVDANVKVLAKMNNEKLADFALAKTFAWGGIYGAATSMEDIEKTFANGVAASLTGQEDTKEASIQKTH